MGSVHPTSKQQATAFSLSSFLQRLIMSSYRENDPTFATKALHVGQEPEQWGDCMSVVPQISLSTTFKQDSPANFRKFEYGRGGNPTRDVLEACLASLDGAKHALTFASGLAASTALTQLLPLEIILSPWMMSMEEPTDSSEELPREWALKPHLLTQ